jgi:hypothetical protein
MMKLRITFEISEKDLAKALLPNGGTITEVSIEEERKRRATRNTQPKEEAAEEKPKRRGRPPKSASS